MKSINLTRKYTSNFNFPVPQVCNNSGWLKMWFFFFGKVNSQSMRKSKSEKKRIFFLSMYQKRKVDPPRDLKDTSYLWGKKKQQNLQPLDILVCNSANNHLWYINRVMDQNIQKLLIFAVFASYAASILNFSKKIPNFEPPYAARSYIAQTSQGSLGGKSPVSMRADVEISFTCYSLLSMIPDIHNQKPRNSV